MWKVPAHPQAQAEKRAEQRLVKVWCSAVRVVPFSEKWMQRELAGDPDPKTMND